MPMADLDVLSCGIDGLGGPYGHTGFLDFLRRRKIGVVLETPQQVLNIFTVTVHTFLIITAKPIARKWLDLKLIVVQFASA